MRSRHGQHGGLVGRMAVAGLTIAGLFALPGCYSNWPPVEGYGQTELNNPSTRGVLSAAGRWALQRYKPAGPVAFNLPAGLRRSGVLEVVGNIGGGAKALTEETATSCTVYHLSRLNLTNDTAEVDVIVPTGSGDGPAYQMTQLRLTGRNASWKVVVAREWETLVRPIPELSYLPAVEYPQAEEGGKPKPWKDEPTAAADDGAGG